MQSQQFQVIHGLVSELQVRQDEEDFVFSSADKATGGAAAAGLALGGLAGAATGAVLSSGDTAERVDFFVCKVSDRTVRGRFGKVSFADGDAVEVAGSISGEVLDAHAITRLRDRTIWMHPHCGRGTDAHRVFSIRWVALVSWIVAPAFTYLMSLLGELFVGGTSIPIDALPWVILAIGAVASVILGVTASRFTKFARLSNDIFVALGFEKPQEVDLHKRLREVSKTMTNEERRNYHPHARWVYKY